ncbi:MAG: hypothetical protein JWN07_678 [Hyphomicrobiales bacterium]|nr:hypothetical protein [Hyphomicrobiales bacterium]
MKAFSTSQFTKDWSAKNQATLVEDTIPPMGSAVATKVDLSKGTAFILGLVAVGCIWLPLQNLTNSSLWSDELATVYIAGADLPLSTAYATRMLPDINPPLYYLVQHFWLQLFSDFTLGSRMLSSLCAITAVVLLATIGGKSLSWPARAFLAAAPVTTFTFIYFATEARAYSLAVLIGVGQVILFQRILGRIRDQIPQDGRQLLTLGLLSFLSGLTHYYGLLYSSSLVGTLCLYALFSRDWQAFWRLAAGGLVFSGANVVYTLMALAHTNFRSDASWIPGDLSYMVQSIREFIWLGAGGHYGAVILMVVVTPIALLTLFGRNTDLRRKMIANALPHLVTVASMICLSLAVSILVAPSTTYRYLLICIPSIWLGMAQVLDVLIRHGHALTRKVTLAAMVLMVICGVPFAALTGGANREDWRASAKFVSEIAACRNSQIPVYSDAGSSSVPLFSLYLNPADNQTPVHISQFKSTGPCPIMLWAVHGLEDKPVETAEAAGGRVVRFEHSRAWDCWLRSCKLMNRDKDLGAVVILKPDMQ